MLLAGVKAGRIHLYRVASNTVIHMASDEMAEDLLLLCPKWSAECQRYVGDSTDITDVF